MLCKGLPGNELLTNSITSDRDDVPRGQSPLATFNRLVKRSRGPSGPRERAGKFEHVAIDAAGSLGSQGWIDFVLL